MKVLRQAKSLNELRQQFEAIKSGVAEDTNFTAAALLWLCEHRNGADSPAAHAWREHAFVTEMRTLRKAITAFTKEQRTFRQDMMARRRVEETLADRIGVLESAATLKDLAAELAQHARELEAAATSGQAQS